MEERPADVFIPVWGHRGEPAALDITVASPFSVSALRQISWVDGDTAAVRAEVRKREKYEAACWEQGILFFPLALESTGGFGDDFLHVLRVFAKRAAALKGAAVSFVLNNLVGDISARLARLTANLWLQRRP